MLVNALTWILYPREKAPVHIVEETGWVSGPFWTNIEKKKFRGTQNSNFSPYRVAIPTALSGPLHKGVLRII
jgi:hypothetical protein